MNSNANNHDYLEQLADTLTNTYIQSVAILCLERELTDSELAEVRMELRDKDWLDWSNAINVLLVHLFGRGDDCPF